MDEWSRNTQWRQGSFLPPQATVSLELITASTDSKTLVIVASHDCDITHDPEIEPQVEVMVGKEISEQEIDGNNSNAKNARKLHIGLSGHPARFAEFTATNKVSVCKSSLFKFLPSATEQLASEEKNIFQRWLACRYRRSAFPDEFENRLKKHKLHLKISRASKRLGSNIAAIYFDVDEGREVSRTDSSETYLLDIVILYHTSQNAESAKAGAESLKTKIEAAFKKKLYDKEKDQWRDIELRHLDVVADEALTYKQSQILKMWRLEHISLGADPQQPIPKE